MWEALVQLQVLSWRSLKRLTIDVGAALDVEYLSQYSDKVVGGDSVVSIATPSGMYGAGIESGRARFSASVQTLGPTHSPIQ